MFKKMFGVTRYGVALFLVTSLVGAAPYSKYGRTCKDIGCLSSEVCVMNEDPCTTYARDQCGRYPTCKRVSDAGTLTCTTMICPTGQYCRTDNGRPACVNTVPDLVDEMFAENGGGKVNEISKRQSGSETAQGSGYPVVSGYPSSSSSSGYPSADSTGSRTPSSGSGYPVGSGYPSSGSASGYPAASSGSSGYPAGSGYPSGSSSGYPSGSNSDQTAYRTSSTGVNSGYPSSGSSGYPGSYSSGYPGSGSSGYPGYPGSGSSGYPGGETAVRRTSGSNVNAGYPSSGGYPNSGQAGVGYPNSGQAGAGYPGQYGGAPGSYPGGQQYPGYNPQGGYYPQGGYNQQGGGYNQPGGYNPQGGYQNPGYGRPQSQPPKNSFTDQVTNFAKNVAQQILTQTILDRVTGRH